ncbi:hypothetical protein U0070_014455 [Myodes glareolus]|uniref:Uncharacterized protein n=1 Tax=Myodes glareolus TaxID=447135 RepID=A0AAW0J4L5_MYOGA
MLHIVPHEEGSLLGTRSTQTSNRSGAALRRALITDAIPALYRANTLESSPETSWEGLNGKRAGRRKLLTTNTERSSVNVIWVDCSPRTLEKNRGSPAQESPGLAAEASYQHQPSSNYFSERFWRRTLQLPPNHQLTAAQANMLTHLHQRIHSPSLTNLSYTRFSEAQAELLHRRWDPRRAGTRGCPAAAARRPLRVPQARARLFYQNVIGTRGT